MIDPPPYVSPSSLATFKSCSLKWKFKYIDRLPDPSGPAALVGSFVHLILEELCKLPAHLRSQEQAKAIAKELWPEFEQEEDYANLKLDDEQAREFRWQAWIATTGLWKLEDPAEVDVVSTEQVVRCDIGDVPFKGIIDRLETVNGEVIVGDYKSGKAPGNRWRSDSIAQVLLYAAAINEIEKRPPSKAKLLYLGQKTLEVTVTERRLEQVAQDLQEVWQAINTAIANASFEAKPTVLCGWCSFVTECDTGAAEVRKRAKAGKLKKTAPALALLDLTDSKSTIGV